jgi:hypothetical protein
MSTTAPTTHQLAEATDTHLADLYGQRTTAAAARKATVDTLHRAAGDRKYTRRPWNMTLAEAKAATPTSAHNAQAHARALENLADRDAELARLDEAIAADNAVWHANGCWNRFFMVPGGHIHATMNCPTCNKGLEPTTFGWLPQLSGLTEAEAVAAHGAILCTVCFPSAPTEWTNGLEVAAAAKKADQCPGSGQYVKTTNWQARYATCPECNSTQSRTSTGKLRAHKAPKTDEQIKADKAAARAAKAAAKANAKAAATQPDPEWEAMQSPELDELLRTFVAAEKAAEAAGLEGPAMDAARKAFQAMNAAAPTGWSSFRRSKDLGLNRLP